jgi:hypothetical protein
MLVVISPAKKLDFENPCSTTEQGRPALLSKTNSLARELKKLKASEVGKLMKLSPKLSELNYSRFQTFKNSYNPSTSKQAAFAFNGDTYTGLSISELSSGELKKAQQKLRILSGLYGVLKPLDLIQPYRLEMGVKFKFASFKSLYEYWKDDVTSLINQDLKSHEYLINCASNEYFSVLDTKKIQTKIITPAFKELKDGEYKMVSFYAKRARGMMARYIIQNNVQDLTKLKKFNFDGYKYNAKLSTELKPVFSR